MSDSLFCSHCELSFSEDEGDCCPECGCGISGDFDFDGGLPDE